MISLLIEKVIIQEAPILRPFITEVAECKNQQNESNNATQQGASGFTGIPDATRQPRQKSHTVPLSFSIFLHITRRDGICVIKITWERVGWAGLSDAAESVIVVGTRCRCSLQSHQERTWWKCWTSEMWAGRDQPGDGVPSQYHNMSWQTGAIEWWDKPTVFQKREKNARDVHTSIVEMQPQYQSVVSREYEEKLGNKWRLKM